MYSPKTRKLLVLFLIIGWAITLLFMAKPNKKLYRNNRILMGTFWEVISPNKDAARIVFDEAARLDGLLSKYKEGSEVSRLNKAGKLQVSPETFFIIKQSKEFYAKTEGAFDITVAPLVDLWGFTNYKFRVPTKHSIEATLKLVGSDKIILHEIDNLVEFNKPGVKIDLGAIAKGFTLDRAVEKLKENNVNSCLINAGGQVYALGDRFGKPWKVAVKNPHKEGVSETLELKNQSVSTSADYQQFFIKNNKRYGHILNPKTGYPAQARAFTVISNNATEADALSTAIFVLGEEKQAELLSRFPRVKIKNY